MARIPLPTFRDIRTAHHDIVKGFSPSEIFLYHLHFVALNVSIEKQKLIEKEALAKYENWYHAFMKENNKSKY